MPTFKVTSINDGKVQVLPEEVLVELFDNETWEKMKEGYYLPWIEVEEQISTMATKYLNQGPRLANKMESRYGQGIYLDA